jgi:hemolysin activation/secretion protein
LSTAFDDKNFDNKDINATSTRYDVRNFTLGLIGNRFDRWGGGGANFASLTVTTGDIDLGTLDTNENVALEGRFTKLSYLLSRQQAVSNQISFYAALSGQLADSNLDSSEKFYLGGANGVRAYPSSEGGGSEGAMLNLELRYRLMPNLVLTGFYDWGQVNQNHDNAIASPANPNRYDLQGAGVAAAWAGPKG